MDLIIDGVSATDRVILESDRVFDSARFEVDEEGLDRGDFDLGVFTVLVPLTVALVPAIVAWLKTRPQLTRIEIKTSEGQVVYSRTGRDQDPQKLAALVQALTAASTPKGAVPAAGAEHADGPAG